MEPGSLVRDATGDVWEKGRDGRWVCFDAVMMGESLLHAWGPVQLVAGQITMSPSEVAAAMLYGPAPTGDEDPHAIQGVTDPGETSAPPVFATQDVLDSLPVGTVVADSDHDDWTKQDSGEWRHHVASPSMRSKTLVALWAPFTVVRIPEVSR
jgi:hypothetical protein